MQHPLGKGTVNVTINICFEERQELGRLSATLDVSLGQLGRVLMLRGLRQVAPEIGSRVAGLRLNRRLGLHHFAP
jgi:hypothetical protein